VSFVVIRDRKILEAFASDGHFDDEGLGITRV
jgi:hypothetical protein